MAKETPTPDWEAQFLVFKQNIFPEMIELLAEQLGVSVDVLNRLEIGFHPGEQAWITREFDDRGNVVGLQKRYRDGKKFMVPGSKRGLVYECVGQNNIERLRTDCNLSKFIRCYNTNIDCPLCGKRDWCMVSSDDPNNPSAVICGRIQQGAVKYIENSGYLHRLKDSVYSYVSSSISISDFPYLVVEGFSDVAAAANMGRVAIGKPNAESGHTFLSSILKGKDVIVIGENDEAGRRGMVKTFNTLRAAKCKSVRKVLPPHDFKDLRKWMPTADIFDQWVSEKADQANNSSMIETIDFNQLADCWRASFSEPLIYFFEDWYKYDGICYRLMQRGWLQAQIRAFFRVFEIEKWEGKHKTVVPLLVNTYFVQEIEAALKCICRTDIVVRTDRPFWIGGAHGNTD